MSNILLMWGLTPLFSEGNKNVKAEQLLPDEDRVADDASDAPLVWCDFIYFMKL